MEQTATTLREVIEADLAVFYEHQRDPVATALAVFSAREWDAFVAHWRDKVLGNATALTRTIVVDDQVVGYVASWQCDGQRFLCYWLGQEYWGRGIASKAVSEFLQTFEHARPIYAYVALSNAPSARVLEKCGFHRISEPTQGADGVVEILFALDAA